MSAAKNAKKKKAARRRPASSDDRAGLPLRWIALPLGLAIALGAAWALLSDERILGQGQVASPPPAPSVHPEPRNPAAPLHEPHDDYDAESRRKLDEILRGADGEDGP